MGVDIAELARRLGIATSYRTDRGRHVAVDHEGLVGIIEAMGIPTGGSGWIRTAIEELDAQAASAAPEPVVVAWEGRLPDRAGPGGPIVLEDGREVAPPPPQGAGAPLPYGYHHAPGPGGDTLVISAPRRCWRPDPDLRAVGVTVPLFAVRDLTHRAPGSLGDLAALGTWLARHGGQVLATLPLTAQYLDEPFDPSPYAPVSRLFWNELYLGDGGAVTAPAVASTVSGVDYRAAIEAAQIRIAAEERALAQRPARAAALNRFVRERPEVADYARFRAVVARYGREWHRWPAALRDAPAPTVPDPALAGADLGAAIDPELDADMVRYHLVAQWLTEQRLATVADTFGARGQLLGLDLAVGSRADGYDTWRHRDVFTDRASVGAPPDSFFVSGQNWGFPPLLPQATRRSGHAYFRAALTHHLRHAGMLRIDHVMGLHRLWWIPDEASPTQGSYVQLPAEELWAIVCLESHRHRALIIGEDLGTVPDEVTDAMARHGPLGTWVAQGSLEALGDGAQPAAPDAGQVASLNTHDMVPFAGWLTAGDIDDQRRFDMIDDQAAEQARARRARVVEAAHRHFGTNDELELLDAVHAWMAGSDAPLVMINPEDLWLERQAQNVPGTHHEHPNWRRAFARSLIDLDPSTLARRLGPLGRRVSPPEGPADA